MVDAEGLSSNQFMGSHYGQNDARRVAVQNKDAMKIVPYSTDEKIVDMSRA